MKDSVKKEGNDTVVYILYYRGRARVVSKEQWEKSWLDWYLREGER